MVSTPLNSLFMTCGDFRLGLDFLLNLMNVDMCHVSVVAIEDLGQFLQGWPSGFNVEKVDKKQLNKDPDLSPI